MRYVNFSDEATITPDDFFMNEALKEARLALSLDEVPIGAVIVSNGKIIGRGHNLTERLNDLQPMQKCRHLQPQLITLAENT